MKLPSFRLPATGVIVALAITAMLACESRANDPDREDDNQFRTDVIYCEEALARLSACCPGFDPTPVLCNYYYSRDSGCGTSTTRKVEPAFTEDESRCILDAQCGDLVANKVCERAQLARGLGATITTDTGSSSSSTSSGFSSSGTSGTTFSGSLSRGPAVCP